MKQIGCPVCGVALELSLAHSRKAKKQKTFLMLDCPEDGRHFRGFINDREFVGRALDATVRQASRHSDGEGSWIE